MTQDRLQSQAAVNTAGVFRLAYRLCACHLLEISHCVGRQSSQRHLFSYAGWRVKSHVRIRWRVRSCRKGLLAPSIDPGRSPASVRNARAVLFNVQTCTTVYTDCDEKFKARARNCIMTVGRKSVRTYNDVIPGRLDAKRVFPALTQNLSRHKSGDDCEVETPVF